jgi:hypothetical protein
MLTLEIHGKFITWPEDFAVLMMKYYHENGVPFIVHRNCKHAECKTGTASSFLARLVESADTKDFTFCCCPQSAR